MNSENTTISPLIYQIVSLVKDASAIMLDRNFTIAEKNDSSNIVTSKDIAVQEFLKNKLTSLIPGSLFLGEEGDFINSDAEYIWVVDPIDGTANYARDLELSVISVALLKFGMPYIGVVYCPYRNQMFTAQKGCGAFLNDEPIHVSDRPLKKSMLCSAMSLYDKRYAKPCFNIIEKIYAVSDDLRRLGTAALELCYLACGKVDLYFEVRLSCWDYAAAVLIVNEAGGIAEIMFNDGINLQKPAGVFAANSSENFDTIKKIIYDEIPNPLF